uniref:Uncharacterized protein n=1 Tax=Candida gigantensis TaxID=271359 RepID=S5U675_9ASCO|nr:hypothetical protein [Candida gigantensis]YP_008475263.1 hypothetical protein [Candida gigantensis]AGS44586.1 hypothetical protein [Candida gigantensis]AGS44587.1 hypothetical protein [Candida gigantensis]
MSLDGDGYGRYRTSHCYALPSVGLLLSYHSWGYGTYGALRPPYGRATWGVRCFGYHSLRLVISEMRHVIGGITLVRPHCQTHPNATRMGGQFGLSLALT